MVSESLRNLLVLVQREYLDTVKTKFFWISILLAPVLMVAGIFLIALLSTTTEIQRYAVIDESGWAADEVRERVHRINFRAFIPRVTEFNTSVEAIPAELQETWRSVSDSDDLQDFVRVVGRLSSDPNAAVEGLRAGLVQDARESASWWVDNQDLVKELYPNHTGNRYQEIEFAGLSRQDLNVKLRNEEIDGIFDIPSTVVDSNEGLSFVSRRAGQSEGDLRSFYQNQLEFLVRQHRVEQLEMEQSDYTWLQAPIRFNEEKATASGRVERVTTRDKMMPYIPLVFVYIMWFIVFVGSSTLINSTVEEKNSKVMEVLLSTMSAAQLMYGKIIGAAASILTMLVVWFALIFASITLIPAYTPLPISTGELLELIKPIYFLKFVIYALIGLFMVAPLMASIGASAANLKAAQSMITPLTVVMMVPLLVMMFVANDTDSILAQVLTYVPIYTPFTLMMRAAAPPHFLLELLAVTVAVATAYVLNLISVRIYSRAILREGPTPTYRQMLELARK